jgi:predicted neuraminidase
MAVGADPAADFCGELIFPPEKWHNHSSCVIEAPDGSLLVCWYHGSGERKADDVIIEGARKRPGQSGWSPRFEMADTPGYPDCNPIMFVDGKERLWLVWPTILDHRWESAVLKARRSSDWVKPDGPPRWEWQEVIHITPRDLGPKLLAAADKLPPWIELLAKTNPRFDEEVQSWRRRAGDELYQRLGWMPRCHVTQLSTGRILLPLYTDTFSISLMAFLDDQGRVVDLSEPLIGFGNIQPSVAERKDGSLLAVMRENGGTGRIRQSESRDGGKTWSPVESMDLPNPGASVELVRLASGNFALIYNDARLNRASLAVSLSDDEGRTWKWTRHLEQAAAEGGRFHYPSMIQGRDGRIHVTYSSHVPAGGCIKYACFSEAWIQAGDPR